MVDKTEKSKSEGDVNLDLDKVASLKKSPEKSPETSPVKSKPASNGSTEEVEAKTASAKTSATTKKDSLIATKKVGGGTKSHPVSAERLKAAEDVIKKKPIQSKSPDSQATIDLKQRAHLARKRAQEAILSKSYVSDPANPLERLADRFETSTRRWEMVIYPSMFAFILLAGYGFYLIYHLTRDISVLSKNVSQMASIVTDVMPKMSKNLAGMTGSIDNMSTDVTDMTQGVSTMSDQMTALRPMNANLANMTDTMNSMNRSVYGMNQNVGNMNRTVSSGPFGMMNDVMPFSSNSYQPQRMAPPMYNPPAIAPPQKSSNPISTRPMMMAPAPTANTK